ncbi:MAG: trigger factor [Armatimonadia bacterium]
MPPELREQLGEITLELSTSKLPGSRLDMTFKFDAQDVQATFSKVYNEFARDAASPGFRPGKAPASVIKRRYKPEIIRSAFWMKAVETYVQPELDKEELQVIDEPEFPEMDELEVVEGQPVELNIKVTVRPEPALPSYEGLKLYRKDATVTDEQVAGVLEQMREAAGKVVPVEDREVVEKGDIVEAEVKMVMEGEEEPEKGSDQEIEVGSGRYQPAIDEAMIGHKAGETVELPREFAEDDENEELRGKKGVIKATIKTIKQKILPELDDEFAKSQGDYESLEDLQTKTREDLEKKNVEESNKALENDALGAVVRDTEIDMPETLVKRMARSNLGGLVQELQQSGMSLQDFMQIVGVDQETLEQREMVRAEMAVKVELVLDALTKAEGIEIGDDEIAEEVTLFAAENNLETDFVQQSLELREDFQDQLKTRAERRLTLAALIAKADIEDVSRERYDEIKEEERKAAEEKAKAEEEAAAAAAAEEAAKAAAEIAEEAEEAPEEEAVEAEEKPADEASEEA